ncbi:hypothetical protein [Campylobacter troglodytis]|uniref:hypothetical protein n=1 Tax=Campylobacter troglodytis TaxID=654363 RepID=UPI0011593EA1|nr:hypothetical protein [Campylobacter troglodytis]
MHFALKFTANVKIKAKIQAKPEFCHKKSLTKLMLDLNIARLAKFSISNAYKLQAKTLQIQGFKFICCTNFISKFTA